jgi:hypothetical protein
MFTEDSYRWCRLPCV